MTMFVMLTMTVTLSGLNMSVTPVRVTVLGCAVAVGVTIVFP